MELIKDYDTEIWYHSGKVNMVTNALSRKSTSIIKGVEMSIG